MMGVKLIQKIVLKSFFAIIVYLTISSLSHFDPIKEAFDDMAYDSLITEYSNIYETYVDDIITTELPKLNVFVIDDDYLEYNKLKNYGYYFPRKEIAYIIESLNLLITEMKVPPKVVFIDYDFHYTEMPYGREMSKDDQLFIEQLIILASKTIVLIPKAKKFHFVEAYFAKNSVPSKNIIFVSPNFLVADDLKTRRFQSYYENDNRVYPNADFLMYLLNKDKCTNVQNIKMDDDSINICGEKLKKMDITENRIIPKFFIKNFQNQYSYGFTNWDKNSSSQNIRSISTLVEESVLPQSLENSLIVIGGDFEGNNDKIAIAYNYDADALKLPGVIMHLNALNSFYYFDGTLKNINFFYGSLIVFFVFILFSYFEEYSISNDRIFIKFLFNFTIMTIIFILISLIIFIKFKLWFNWLAPLFAYQLFDILLLSKDIIKNLKSFITNF